MATKSRRYSASDKKFIEEEVAKLLEDGVIEPSQSSWRAQVLITKDERHKKRKVIDYSQTVLIALLTWTLTLYFVLTSRLTISRKRNIIALLS